MKKVSWVLACIMFMYSCRDKNIPDVSDIKVSMEVQRFEQDFFAIDTVNIANSVRQLGRNYPLFTYDFISEILGLSPVVDTSKETQNNIRRFIGAYRPIYDSAQVKFGSMNDIISEVKKGLQFVRHYFPAYVPPKKLITFIGPIEGYANVLTPEGFAVGLQSYMGKDFFLYNTDIGRETYPPYISRRFAREYIPINCMKNIIDDISPEEARGAPLVEQMVDKGKRLFVLDKILPTTADSLKIGYTEKQLKGCYANEGRIWSFFLTNNLLLNNDPAIIKGYISEAPGTPELGEGSPGFIGLFVGWQIVNRYMEKHPSTTLIQLLRSENRKIYEESKYRPR